jgi:hypothetical protein
MNCVVLSNEMSDVSGRKERINAEAAEYTEGTEQKWKAGSTGLELSDWVLRSARRKHPGFPKTFEKNTNVSKCSQEAAMASEKTLALQLDWG